MAASKNVKKIASATLVRNRHRDGGATIAARRLAKTCTQAIGLSLSGMCGRRIRCGWAVVASKEKDATENRKQECGWNFDFGVQRENCFRRGSLVVARRGEESRSRAQAHYS